MVSRSRSIYSIALRTMTTMLDRLRPAWGAMLPQLGIGQGPVLLLPVQSLPTRLVAAMLDLSDPDNRAPQTQVPRIPAHVLAVDLVGNANLCGADPSTLDERRRALSPGPAVDFEEAPGAPWWQAISGRDVVLLAYVDVFLAAAAAEIPERLGRRISLLRVQGAVGVLPCPRVLRPPY